MSPPWKRPESVLVLVCTVAGEVLLLRRCWPADFWQSVTGSLKWEETEPLQAARRELWEETGLGSDARVEDCNRRNRFPIVPPWRSRYGDAVENIEHVFRVVLLTRRPIRLNPAEHCEFQWLPWEAAAAKATSYTNQAAIAAYAPTARIER